MLAGTLALVIGGLVLSGGGPGPAPIAVPSAEPSPSAGDRGAPVPDAIKGGWSAASRGTALEGTPVTTIVLGGSSMDSTARQFSMDYPGMPSRKLDSNLVEIEPGVLRLRLGSGASGCEVGAEGRYRWSLSADGQWLTLEPITDACAVRSEIVTGTWQRNVGFSSGGGPGIATNFEPYIALTLPDVGLGSAPSSPTRTPSTPTAPARPRRSRSGRTWTGSSTRATETRVGSSSTPGWTRSSRTCARTRASRSREETEFQIDGHRAVEVVFQLGADIAEPCWDFDGDPANKTGVLLWVPQGEQNVEAFWNGELDSAGHRDRHRGRRGDPGLREPSTSSRAKT